MSSNVDHNGYLTREEQSRVDALLSQARSLHYTSFLIAGLSLAFASLDISPEITLPAANIKLPSVQASVAAYLLSIFLGVGSHRLFKMAYPWLAQDPRRPPFPWIALGKGPIHVGYVMLWVLLPTFITALAAAIVLGCDVPGTCLLMGGFFLFALLDYSSLYVRQIWSRVDDRGNAITLSIWLLYWYRIVRGVTLTALFICPVLAAVPKCRAEMLFVTLIAFYAGGVLAIIRIIGAFIYEWIDRIGTRLGFPPEQLTGQAS